MDLFPNMYNKQSVELADDDEEPVSTDIAHFDNFTVHTHTHKPGIRQQLQRRTARRRQKRLLLVLLFVLVT